MKHRYTLFFALLLLPLLGACSPKKTAPALADAYFPVSIDDAPLQLQIALSDSERTKGLMNRDSMPESHGMAFVFNAEGPRAFWMRNTRIPLDLGYFDAQGTLLELHALYPYNETPVPSRSQKVLLVVETNQGWFRKNKIRPGAQLDLHALIQAIELRGQSIEAFPLQPSH